MKHFIATKKGFLFFALTGLICIGIVGFLIAQQEQNEDDECRWHLQDQKHSTNGYNTTSNVGINALFWNDCTGEIYHLYREGTDPHELGASEDWDEEIESRRINL